MTDSERKPPVVDMDSMTGTGGQIDWSKVDPHHNPALTGWAKGRLFEIHGTSNETIVVVPYEYEPTPGSWRCTVVRGSSVYPVGGYDIIVSESRFTDENEVVIAEPQNVRNGGLGPVVRDGGLVDHVTPVPDDEADKRFVTNLTHGELIDHALGVMKDLRSAQYEIMAYQVTDAYEVGQAHMEQAYTAKVCDALGIDNDPKVLWASLRRGGWIDLLDFQEEVSNWIENNFSGDTSPTARGCVLAEESGELIRAVVKRDQGIRGTPEQWEAEAEKESVDVTVAVAGIINLYGISLAHAIREHWPTLRARNFTVDNIGHGMPVGDSDSTAVSEPPEADTSETAMPRDIGGF